jgi:hypothetical protein
MDSIGPSKAMPKLVNACATFRDELLLFALSDIETWSCQAFDSTSARGSTDLHAAHPLQRYRTFDLMFVNYCRVLLDSLCRNKLQLSTLEPRDNKAALVQPTAAGVGWRLTS